MAGDYVMATVHDQFHQDSIARAVSAYVKDIRIVLDVSVGLKGLL